MIIILPILKCFALARTQFLTRILIGERWTFKFNSKHSNVALDPNTTRNKHDEGVCCLPLGVSGGQNTTPPIFYGTPSASRAWKNEVKPKSPP